MAYCALRFLRTRAFVVPPLGGSYFKSWLQEQSPPKGGTTNLPARSSIVQFPLTAILLTRNGVRPESLASSHVEPARGVDHLAGDITKIAARQRHDGVGDLGRGAGPAQRDQFIGAQFREPALALIGIFVGF